MTKPWLSFDEQAQKMLDRGMVGERSVIASHLRYVNYYRLLGYSYLFRLQGDPQDRFAPGLSFETVLDHYVFDQKLRILFMEAIERIEVAARTQIAYHHAKAWGPTGYANDSRSLPNLRNPHYSFLSRLHKCLYDAREQPYLKNFARKNAKGAECFFPPERAKRRPAWPPPWPAIWVVSETMSIGNIVVMYQGCHDRERERIADEFGLTSGVMESWLLMWQLVRNICAHHSRLWNKPLAKSPAKPPPKTFPNWYAPLDLGAPQNVFGALSATACMLHVISPASKWVARIKALLVEHPHVPLEQIGFPPKWETSPIWA